jgi:hypothetical protein
VWGEGATASGNTIPANHSRPARHSMLAASVEDRGTEIQGTGSPEVHPSH